MKAPSAFVSSEHNNDGVRDHVLTTDGNDHTVSDEASFRDMLRNFGARIRNRSRSATRTFSTAPAPKPSMAGWWSVSRYIYCYCVRR